MLWLSLLSRMHSQMQQIEIIHGRRGTMPRTHVVCLLDEAVSDSDAVLDAVLITRDKRGANYIQYTLLVHINRKKDSDDKRATTGVRGKGVSKPWEE